MKDLKAYVKKGLFHKAVVEDGSDVVFIVDYNGEILYHNKSVEETLGYKPNKLIGKIFFDYILPETLASFKKKYKRSVQKPYSESVEFQFLCSNRIYKYFEFNSINLYQKEGVKGLILDCRDITQRKKDAEELLRAQKAREQFLANISHEIRTPINGIAGMVTLLGQRPFSKDQETYLNAIKTAANNLKVIINDILDLASIESGKLKFEKIGFRLSELLNALIDTFKIQTKEKGLQLILSIDASADKVLVGDPVRLNQILINLISNAIKFTPAGSITIKCWNEKKGKNNFHFEVSDTGIGIPADKRKTIFESFSQADASVTRKYGGTGLGLTIVKQLVKLQHGTINLRSEENKGSKFTVILPYAIGKTKDLYTTASVSGKGKSSENDLKKLKVLLVEDNDINRLYATTVLKTWECTIETAENGYVAFEKAKSHSFDVILMDLQMPVMDGYEATRAIRASSASQVPIIALTANATKSDVERCLAAGMNDCIAKPFTPEDLFKVLVKFTNKTPSKPENASLDTSIKQDRPAVSPSLVNLDYLKKVSDGNTAFINEIIEAFLKITPESIIEIETFAAQENWEMLAKSVHKIKPSLTLLGVNHLKALAAEIELECKSGDFSNLNQKPAQLVSELKDVIRELNGLVNH